MDSCGFPWLPMDTYGSLKDIGESLVGWCRDGASFLLHGAPERLMADEQLVDKVASVPVHRIYIYTYIHIYIYTYIHIYI